MRIFLSYASERCSIAATVAVRLRALGHTVFFDRDDLPPGGTYDQRIAVAIQRADLFIFFVSPESLEKGRYTLTEIAHAERRWPNPDRRVLPVLIEPVPRPDLPPYLLSVTHLEPRGPVETEVALAVERDFTPRQRWKSPPAISGIGVVAVIATLAVGIAAWKLMPHGGDTVDLRIAAIRCLDPGLFGLSSTYRVDVQVEDLTGIDPEVEELVLESRPANRLTMLDVADSTGASALAFSENGHFNVAASLRSEGAPAEVRVCWTRQTVSHCSDWTSWLPESQAVFGSPPDRSIRESARDVVAAAEGIVVVSGPPPRVTRFAAGAWGKVYPVPANEDGARPVSVTEYRGSRVLVAMQRPSGLATVDLDSGAGATIIDVAELPRGRNEYDEPISMEIVSVVGTENRRWLKTGGGVGAAGLFAWRKGAWGWGSPRLVSYNNEISFDLDDLVLRRVDGELWGVPRNTTPSSVYLFGDETWMTWPGHDLEVVACATDVASHPNGLVIMDCDGQLAVVSAHDDGTMERLGELGAAPLWPHAAGSWDSHLLSVADSGVLVALNQETVHHVEVPRFRSRIARVGVDSAEILFETDRGLVLSMAISGGWVIAVVESSDGRRDLVVVRLP